MSRLWSPALVFVCAASALAGCGVTLTDAGKGVQLMKSDPPGGCKEIGSLEGEGNTDVEAAKNDIRNKAAQKGANYVRMETIDGPYVTGTAYQCPPGSSAASAR
jgi:hypothetical protein